MHLVGSSQQRAWKSFQILMVFNSNAFYRWLGNNNLKNLSEDLFTGQDELKYLWVLVIWHPYKIIFVKLFAPICLWHNSLLAFIYSHINMTSTKEMKNISAWKLRMRYTLRKFERHNSTITRRLNYQRFWSRGQTKVFNTMLLSFNYHCLIRE